MKARKVDSRTITPDEVMDWRGSDNRHKITDEECDKIAHRLTSMRWPSDPPAPDLPAKGEIPEGEYWNVSGATNAARTLLADLPAMLGHWERLLRHPTTAGGYPAIDNLQQALSAAMPYIESPFGDYKPRTSYKQPKDWHIYAVLIANFITKILVDAGRAKPALTHNSVTVRIIREAIRRMGFPRTKALSKDVVGTHLRRWQERYK